MMHLLTGACWGTSEPESADPITRPFSHPRLCCDAYKMECVRAGTVSILTIPDEELKISLGCVVSLRPDCLKKLGTRWGVCDITEAFWSIVVKALCTHSRCHPQ